MGVRRSGTADGKVQETILDPLKEVILEKNDLKHQMAGLLPRTIYIVNITSLFMDKTWGIPFTVKFETGNASNMLKVEAPVLVQGASSNSPAIIQLKPASFDTVLAYYVIVLSTKVAQNVKPDDVKLDVLISQTWLNKPREMQPNWIAGSFDSASLPWQMFLGDETRPGTGEYVNYRLQPSNEEENFVAFLRVITTSEEQYSSEYSPPLFSGGSSQIPVTFPHPTEAIIHILPQLDPQEPSSESVTHHDGSSIAAPLCVTLLFMLLFVGLFFFARKRRYAFKWTLPEPWKLILPSNEVPSYLQIDPVEMRRLHLQTPAMMSHPPVAVSEFEKHVQAMLINDGILFAQEYESIEPGQQYMCENSELEVNKPKNRYDDVLAFDHSRVILRSQDGGQAAAGIDYINANFVDGFRRQNAYIATQGPLPTTFADFWKMVWEQRSAAVVMMTRLEENHKVRCHQYWPDKGTQTYGQINVTILDSIELSSYTIRTFSIFNESNNNEPREVQHFQFTSWSDEGVPENPMPLLLFMRRVKFLVTPDSGPVIVHCSAGCGRSGVYIVIDSMLDRIKHLRTIDVYGHVTCLRCQRNFMVQTEEQYVFIHRALIQAIKYGNTEIPTRNFKQHLERLQAKQSFGLRFEYQRLFSPDFNPRMFESAISPKNLSKNRNKEFLPNEAKRVLLEQTRGGDDFINASYMDGYVFKQSYILAQNPLRDTVEDFWRMVISTRCQTLVMLTDFINEQDACVCYWPTDRPLRFPKFVVELLSEQSKLDYILRQFSITPNETGISTTVRQFQLTDWSTRSVLTVAKELQKIRQNKNKNTFSPAILHCSDGVGRSGVACTVMTVIERLQFEGVIDVFQTVCVARHQRFGFIRNEEQYDMCHQVIAQYLDDAYTH